MSAPVEVGPFGAAPVSLECGALLSAMWVALAERLAIAVVVAVRLGVIDESTGCLGIGTRFRLHLLSGQHSAEQLLNSTPTGRL